MAVALDINLAPFGERVHDRDANPVQAATDLIAAAAKFAARVQYRHDDFKRGETRALVVFFYRNAPPVILDGDRAIGVNSDFDGIGFTGHDLVNAVIDNLGDKVMQATLIGRANVHTRTYAYCL